MIKMSEEFLSEQIITYIGNKRKLLPYIEKEIKDIKKELGKDRLICADLFSGSGVVSRLLKLHSDVIITDDLEDYSRVINECYLYNRSELDYDRYSEYKSALDLACETLHAGIITKNYAPENESDIKPGERVFYTKRNAMYIDTAMDYILSEIEKEYQKFFIAPLLYEASVHANTAGVFKGFYKNTETGTGQYGGDAENCLQRICADIHIKEPVFSDNNAEHISFQGDANKIVKDISEDIGELDAAYIDPPYNQHPYGSNYFMLNTILHHKLGKNISKVSGIPDDWNRSDYNKKAKVITALSELIENLNSKYIIVSYNSEGFVTKEDMSAILEKHGKVKTISVKYNTFRGSRNLRNRDIHVDEYLFILRR